MIQQPPQKKIMALEGPNWGVAGWLFRNLNLSYHNNTNTKNNDNDNNNTNNSNDNKNNVDLW